MWVLALGTVLALTYYHSAQEVARAELAHRDAEAALAAFRAKQQEPVYITLPGADTIEALRDDYLASDSLWKVVNKERDVPFSYVPQDLTALTVPVRSGATGDERTVRQVLLEPLTQMFAAAEAEGHYLMVGSAYRSAATQAQLFASYVAASGEAEASQYSARSGHSEHQLGLAVDISTLSQKCYLSECFTSTPDGQWLAKNAYRFGFTLRYQEGKEAITGYNFEPWHYRYVGVPLATALQQSQLTLEEALPYLEAALETLRANKAI